MRRKLRLSDLAFACYIFPGLEKGYRDAYSDFLKNTANALDMHNDKHIKHLLTWLNQWGCRLEQKSHPEISGKLISWFREYEKLLPQKDKKLLDLSDKEITEQDEVYDKLAGISFTCSSPTGHRKIGHTCASKILFALRSDVYPIWDVAMKKEYEKTGCTTYSEYMKRSSIELRQLSDDCQRNGIELHELPRLLGREGESLLKLLDEHHWVFITRELRPPSTRDFEEWYKWAK